MCKKDLIYGLNQKRQYYNSVKRNGTCMPCRNKKLSKLKKGKPSGREGCTLSKEHRLKISISNIESHKHYTHPMLGKHHTAASKKRMSKQRSGKNNPMYGKKHTKETCRKIRLKKIERLNIIFKNHGQTSPNYNIEACKFMDEYGKKHGYTFQHAENGGEYFIKELGYWLDGYDMKRNVVFEYDEPYHNKKSQRKKDQTRLREIKKCLHCKFIRYNTVTKKFKKYGY